VSLPYILSRFGDRIDLIDPTPAQVDFAEIADTLAHVYRWTGAAKFDVSVAWHTIIGVEIARWQKLEWAIPHWLLHDAHEARLGDIVTPVAQAIAIAVDGAFSSTITEWVEPDQRPNGIMLGLAAIHRLKSAHDDAIHAAARLPLPDKAMADAVKRIDLIALMTERRDYLPDPPEPWLALEDIPRLPRVLGPPLSPGMCAERLLQLFRHHLPVFTGQALSGASAPDFDASKLASSLGAHARTKPSPRDSGTKP
jgi:uncharacterized protein